jgi:ribonuclease R
VELREVYVEGLVHITSLPNDYYHFDAVGHRLVGERGGRIFRLGDPLRVKVVRVDLDDRKIDFEAVVGSGVKRRRGRGRK